MPDYGRMHQVLRAQMQRRVRQGGVKCWRCGREIDPAEPVDLGHDDDDPTIYRGAEHRRCNRATSGRKKIQQRWAL